MLICLNCGKQLTGKQTKYCSIKCKKQNRYKGRRSPHARRETCLVCEKNLTSMQTRFCSVKCKNLSRSENRRSPHPPRETCFVCDKPLIGTQTRYCSRVCKSKHQSNAIMKRRSLARKQTFVEHAGGCCQRCGYDTNLSALNFHHLDPDEKTQSFSMTRLRYKLDDAFFEEIENCELLCSNCHMEEHYPHLALTELQKQEWSDASLKIRVKHEHCIQCGDELTGRQRQFCSKTCTDQYRWLHRNEKKQPVDRYTQCVICETPLKGNQRKFCSEKCKNIHHQAYDKQQERGIGRKLFLVEQMGGACTECGYQTNLAALNFHHVNGDDKAHKLDLRHLGNRSWEAILGEIEKCVLVCANCHAGIHNPDLEAVTQQ